MLLSSGEFSDVVDSALTATNASKGSLYILKRKYEDSKKHVDDMLDERGFEICEFYPLFKRFEDILDMYIEYLENANERMEKLVREFANCQAQENALIMANLIKDICTK